jgi:hypothetical protein
MATTTSRTKKSASGKAKSGSAGKNKSGGAWKLERASVTLQGEKRPRSNKYSKTGDADKKPESGERTRAWVGGYTRADGKKVKGHYREINQSGKR